MASLRRGLPVFLVLLAAYATTLGLHAQGGSRFTADEARQLLVADSLASDRDLDLRDEYATRAWGDWYPGALEPVATVTDGRLHGPQGVGFPLLISPAYAVAGPTGVELLLAALFAAAFAVAAAIGRRLVPDPWPDLAVLAVGLSPPALAAATTVAPATAGALLLTGATLLALRIRDEPRLVWAFWCAVLVALLPWLAVGLTLPAVVIAGAMARWLTRRGHGLAGFTALEVVLTSAVFYVVINDRLFGGPVPDAARAGGIAAATGLHDVGTVAERLLRLPGLLIDQDVGALRWAPILALAIYAAWLLLHSRRARLARLVADRVDVEVTAGLLLAVCSAGLLVAAIGPRDLQGAWLIPHHAPVVLPLGAALVAWGWTYAGRLAPILAVLTLIGSGWMLVGSRLDDSAGLAPPHGALPWAGAERVLPRF